CCCSSNFLFFSSSCSSHFLFLSFFVRLISCSYTVPRLLETQEQQQPTYVALSYAARRENQTVRKKSQPKLSLSLSSTGEGLTQSLHTPGTPAARQRQPVTPPMNSSSSFHSSTPTEYPDHVTSQSTRRSAISSESILGSMGMNGVDEKPFACPVPGYNKRYKNVNGIKYHAKNGHRNQIRARKPFKCHCWKNNKASQGLRHHTIHFHPPLSADIICKM
uniref:JAZF zinc finger 1 n=1 Tax=Gadus morhua TaxID=8049 RepID=A0A8C4Z549_GADMO